MNPPPTPPEEGSQCQGTLAEFPSWEGPGVGRFMESHLSFFRMHWDDEPRKPRSAGFQPAGSGSIPAAQVCCGQGCPQNWQPGWLRYGRTVHEKERFAINSLERHDS